MAHRLVLGAAAALPVFGLIPVMPSEGPLFPDYDCLQATPKPGRDAAIDWPAWLGIFEKVSSKKWMDYSNKYLEMYMDSDAEAYLQHVEECPLGVLNAELLLYTVAQLQGDSESAAFYAERAIRGIRSLPLHIIAGSRWPLLALLTSEELRKQLTPSGRDVANDTILNCENLEEPLLNWRRYQSLFWGDDRK
ncbi:unnamed protein product, partial [Polarella glacialis]